MLFRDEQSSRLTRPEAGVAWPTCAVVPAHFDQKKEKKSVLTDSSKATNQKPNRCAKDLFGSTSIQIRSMTRQSPCHDGLLNIVVKKWLPIITIAHMPIMRGNGQNVSSSCARPTTPKFMNKQSPIANDHHRKEPHHVNGGAS